MNAVHPFSARIVRPEWAVRIVTPLSDSLDADFELRRPNVDPRAYDDSAASLYVYAQRLETDTHVGVVCDVSALAFENGQVRGHEEVLAERVEALVRNYATAPEQVGLVALLHRAGPVFARTVAETCRTTPLLRFIGPDGLEQTVWRMQDHQATAELCEELGASRRYIADGHHRVAARLQQWLLAGRPPNAGLLCVIYPMDGLRLSSFHRRVPGPVDAPNLLALLATEFDVREATGPPARSGSFGVYVGRRWFDARFEGVRREGVAGLDVTILHDRVLEPFVSESGLPRDVEVAPGRRSLHELVEHCDGDAGALFTLAPPALDVLAAVADRGETMPPKTTYFEPKPCAGIFLRPVG
jgi:uncharacterized protein (DUF1015 family)